MEDDIEKGFQNDKHVGIGTQLKNNGAFLNTIVPVET